MALEECLQRFTEVEKLDHSSLWRCQKCAATTPAANPGFSLPAIPFRSSALIPALQPHSPAPLGNIFLGRMLVC